VNIMLFHNKVFKICHFIILYTDKLNLRKVNYPFSVRIYLILSIRSTLYSVTLCRRKAKHDRHASRILYWLPWLYAYPPWWLDMHLPHTRCLILIYFEYKYLRITLLIFLNPRLLDNSASATAKTRMWTRCRCVPCIIL